MKIRSRLSAPSRCSRNGARLTPFRDRIIAISGTTPDPPATSNTGPLSSGFQRTNHRPARGLRRNHRAVHRWAR